MKDAERFAGGSAEANEQRDKRAARSLRPADARIGFERNFNVRSESVAFAGATATASDLERHTTPLKKFSPEPRFFVEVTRTFAVTQTNAAWIPNPQTPNKAPEPTSLAVTPHAYACVAPSSAVAHL